MAGRVLGLALLVAALVVFLWDLYHFVQIGTCASGPSPYAITRPCPVGTATLAWSFVAAIFLMPVFAGLASQGIGWAWLLLWCGIFIGGGIAVLLPLFNGTVSPYGGAKAACITVAVVFIPMGIAPLFFLSSFSKKSSLT
ncbi:MAG: hypothetical protein NVSMB31_14050 [Vulcanimicrobiaceae bacterium]